MESMEHHSTDGAEGGRSVSTMSNGWWMQAAKKGMENVLISRMDMKESTSGNALPWKGRTKAGKTWR
jgi:hypothetical protein